MSPAGLRRYRAERLLRKGFPELRAKVLMVVRSQLRGKGITLDHTDLEACYAQAWQGLYATVLGGEQVENPSAWLVLVTFRRAIDESRAASRAGVVGVGEMGACPARLDAQAPDLASELDDRTRLRQVFEAMRATLSARECEAASLCYLQGLSRAEAATQIGISDARMRKLMEGTGPGRPGVAAKVGELLDTVKGGGWCEHQSSLVRAYAFGILDPDGQRYALAAAHCRECSACRAYVASLRGLASVLPPLPLLSRLVLSGGAGTTAGAGGGITVDRVVGGAGSAAGTATSGSGFATGSGFAGSLTAKLAVTAAVVLGAGYAVLGSRAHGSLAARHHAAVLRPVVSSPSPRASLSVGAATPTARIAHSTARRRFPGNHHTPHNARSTNEAAAREFGPERVSSSTTPAASPATSSSAPRGGAASNEFGFE
jgi:DNA-directed RNA polymerase specialized sigma24 family protein